MARNFRPVEEIWGTGSSVFLPSEKLEEVLVAISENAFAGTVEAADYDDIRSVWIEDAIIFFDFLAEKTTEDLVPLLLNHLSMLTDDDAVDLKNVIENIKSLAIEWRESIQEDGSINFYIDQF